LLRTAANIGSTSAVVNTAVHTSFQKTTFGGCIKHLTFANGPPNVKSVAKIV
jgi:hypothetical protein